MSFVSDHLNNLLKQKESTLLYGGYVNMLKTLESVFLSPKHWVLEFLQNAEDAGAKRFLIWLGKDSLGTDALWVLNDGTEFDEKDFRTICDVKSEKLPSLSFRGYIGIGFKSIFRITDRVDIHSGEFHFSFNKESWRQFLSSENIPISRWPWEILPIEIPPIELNEGYRTCFRVPLVGKRAQDALPQISEFLDKKFPREANLFLNHVEIVEIQTSQNTFTISKRIEERQSISEGEKEVVAVNTEALPEIHYAVFRKTLDVPHEVQQDEETERVHRSEVSKREIGLVFALDSQRYLEVLSGKLAGVYSFLPVEGEQTGLPFGIFGDFIPQVGRELINYGVRWNEWICDEIREFFKVVVKDVFLFEQQWRFFPAKLNAGWPSPVIGPGKEFWESRLREPLKEFLDDECLYPDKDGVNQTLNELIAVELPQEASEAIGKERLEKLTGKKVAHSLVADYVKSHPKLKKLDTYQLLREREILEALKDEPETLTKVYGGIGNLTDYMIKGRDGRDTPLSHLPFVLTDDGELFPPSQVTLWNADLSTVGISVPLNVLQSLKELLRGEGERRLHPNIARDEQAASQLRRCRLHTKETEDILQRLKALVDNITIRQYCPASWVYPDDLIQTQLFLIANDHPPKMLVAADNTILGPGFLFVPRAPLDWEPLWQEGLLPGYQPLHGSYFRKDWLQPNGLTWDWLPSGMPPPTKENIWERFRRLGLYGFSTNQDTPLIQDSGQAVAEYRLTKEGHKPSNVSDRDRLGYDIECQGHCDKVFEVKGMSTPKAVTLEESETRAAKQKGDTYVLVCVYNLPSPIDSIGYKEISDPDKLSQLEGRTKISREAWLRYE